MLPRLSGPAARRGTASLLLLLVLLPGTSPWENLQVVPRRHCPFAKNLQGRRCCIRLVPRLPAMGAKLALQVALGQQFYGVCPCEELPETCTGNP